MPIKLNSTGGGSVTLDVPSTASTYTQTFPAANGSVVVADGSGNVTIASGNLNFTGTSQRITGDFSNATVTNRLAFQTNTTNSNTSVYAIPNGTASVSAYTVLNNSTPTNASTGQLLIASGDVQIRSDRNGSGTYLPMSFYTSGAVKATLDTSGNFGIGTATPASYGKLAIEYPATGSAVNNVIGIYQSAGVDAASLRIAGYRYTGSAQTAIDFIQNSASNFQSQIAFSTDGGGGMSERARVTSTGNLSIGSTTGIYNGKIARLFVYQTQSEPVVSLYSNTTNATNQICFNNPNGEVGTINTVGTSTSYGTSSDYRLKENIKPMQSALAKIAQLNPVTFTWKADGSDGQGFIAHELQAVVPDCVFGEKDAVDERGNPRYQNVDTSFLVATLTKAIQEQQAQIEALTARIAQLEAK